MIPRLSRFNPFEDIILFQSTAYMLNYSKDSLSANLIQHERIHGRTQCSVLNESHLEPFCCLSAGFKGVAVSVACEEDKVGKLSLK